MTRPVASRLALTTLAAVVIAAAPAGLDRPRARRRSAAGAAADQPRQPGAAGPRPRVGDAARRARRVGQRRSSLGSPEAPAFVRALGAVPASVEPMAALPDAVLFKGTLAPEIKAAMGLRIAQVNGSPYVAAHMLRRAQGARPRRRAAVGAGGQRRQPPVDVGAGGAALCRDR